MRRLVVDDLEDRQVVVDHYALGARAARSCIAKLEGYVLCSLDISVID